MGKPAEKKRKKKGRPSLLDLQKRRLRLQQQLLQQSLKKNPRPSPNPYLHFPNSSAGRGRNPNPDPEVEEQEYEEEDEEDERSGSIRKRREKKLDFVLRIPDNSENSPRHLGSSASELECEGSGYPRKRKIEAVESDENRTKKGGRSFLKATEPLQEALGPRTTLPDKKLLLFILDRLQKKDTYGVFSEPVDPEELPDYHEVIQHPMDFGTVRKKLSQGAYRSLEQFEKDVFLISSNAMRYNAPDSIYFRQARSIQDLAKKNFENLRQDSDIEPETRNVLRRGRPPSKDFKGHGRHPAVLAAMRFLEPATLVSDCGSKQCHALLDKSTAAAKSGLIDASASASLAARSHGSSSWIGMNKGNASLAKGFSMKLGRRARVTNGDRRSTCDQLQLYSYGCEPLFFTLLDGKKKQLAAVGLHVEYAYARSLARFAADIGPVGWVIAAKKIEKALPPGTMFGRGWVGDKEAPPQSHVNSPPSNQSSSQSVASSSTVANKSVDNYPQKLASSEGISKSTQVESAPVAASGCRYPDSITIGEGWSEISTEDPQPNIAFQAHQSPALLPVANGFAPGHRFDPPSQPGGAMRPMRPPVSLDPLAQWKASPKQEKLVTIQPDLNVGFQPSSSSASVSRVDTQHPELALQL